MRRLIWLILLACAACGAQDQPVRFDLRNGYLIVVQCSAGELHGLSGIVDTGTTDTVLDNRIVARLGLSTASASATMVDRETAVRSVVAPEIRLGPLRSTPASAIATDLSGMSTQLGVRIDVIVGMDVLRASDFEIDYGARLLRFGNVAPLRHRAAITDAGGLWTVEVTGLGAPVRLLVDTGFSDLLLFSGGTNRGWKLRDAEVNLATNATPARLKFFEPPSIGIGDWQGQHRIVLIAARKREQPALFDGLLGPRFLNARRIAFEFSRGTLSWD